jgi:dihydroorotase
MPARGRRRRDEGEGAPAFDPPAWVLAGRVWWGDRLRPLEIGISEEGRIVALGQDLRAPERRDVGDRIILPSATDLHVHFRYPEPGRAAESWGCGTVQAALGGVGLVGEMPNTDPPVRTGEDVRDRRARGEGRLAVDMLLYAALERPGDVARAGREAGAFKLYLSPTTGIEPDPELPDRLGELLRAVAATGLPLSVHAEDPAHFRPGETPTSTAAWDRHRPVDAETAAIEELLRASPSDLRLHVAHVTDARVVPRLSEAGVSFEVTPHHLLLSAREDGDAFGKVNPPLRSEPARAALLAAFEKGEVPCLASDHAPHARAEKERPFDRAPSGVPGVATLLPLFLARVRAGDLALARLTQAACDRPARWLGQPRGRIALGHRADLLVVDPTRRTRLRAEGLPAPCGWTPFEGREAIFPVEHYLDGRRIVEGGEYVGTPVGGFVRPEFAREGRAP